MNFYYVRLIKWWEWRSGMQGICQDIAFSWCLQVCPENQVCGFVGGCISQPHLLLLPRTLTISLVSITRTHPAVEETHPCTHFTKEKTSFAFVSRWTHMHYIFLSLSLPNKQSTIQYIGSTHAPCGHYSHALTPHRPLTHDPAKLAQLVNSPAMH
jgi:hypothetical protein